MFVVRSRCDCGRRFRLCVLARDTCGSCLFASAHRRTILRTDSRARADSHPSVPVIVFAKGAWFALRDMSPLDCNVVGLDWNMDREESRAALPGKTLQGNMDPCLLYANFDTIRKETRNMLKSFGPQRHIANLGHGLYPDIEKDHVRCFVEAVKEFDWKKQHQTA